MIPKPLTQTVAEIAIAFADLRGLSAKLLVGEAAGESYTPGGDDLVWLAAIGAVVRPRSYLQIGADFTATAAGKAIAVGSELAQAGLHSATIIDGTDVLVASAGAELQSTITRAAEDRERARPVTVSAIFQEPGQPIDLPAGSVDLALVGWQPYPDAMPAALRAAWRALRPGGALLVEGITVEPFSAMDIHAFTSTTGEAPGVPWTVLPTSGGLAIACKP